MVDFRAMMMMMVLMQWYLASHPFDHHQASYPRASVILPSTVCYYDSRSIGGRSRRRLRIKDGEVENGNGT